MKRMSLMTMNFYSLSNGGVGMSKYSLDITAKDKPFMRIEVEDDKVLLGAYEDGSKHSYSK